MSEKKKPLPKPPSTPFGQRKQREDPDEPLLADRMAMAMSEGNLEEFLKNEMPGSEHAQKLAMMMAGMTGMMPPDFVPSSDHLAEQGTTGKEPVAPPEDLVNAVRSGNVKDLMSILQREHARRTGDSVEQEVEDTPPAERDSSDGLLGGEEKETLDACISIAVENNLSLDWVVLRALKLYVNEYRKSGRL